MPGFNVVNGYGADQSGENPSASGYFEFGTDKQATRPLRLNSDGSISFGDGTSTPDTTLARSAAGALTINGDLIANAINWFDVKDGRYGALGDGTTDDTAAIQAAITAASAVSGFVYFPAATYVVTGTTGAANLKRILTLSTGVTLYGPGAILKVKSTTGDYFTMFGGATTGTDLSGLIVDGLTFDQSANTVSSPSTMVADNNYRAAVVVYTGSRITIRNCRVTGANAVWSFTVNSATATDINISNNLFDNYGSSSAFHDNSTIYVSAQRMVITDNIFDAVSSTPFGAITAIETHGDGQIVTDNTVSGFYRIANLTGNAVTHTVGINFTGNVGNQLGVGVQLWANTFAGLTGGAALRNVMVADNTFDLDYDRWIATITGPMAGILLDRTSDYGINGITIDNNIIRWRTFAGVPVAGDFSSSGVSYYRSTAVSGLTDFNIKITNNTFDGPPGTGVYVQPKAAVVGLEISRNTVRNPATGGGAAFSSEYRSGIVFEVTQDTIKRVDVINNKIIDDRATGIITSSVNLSLITVGFTPARVNDNVQYITDTASTAVLIKPSATQPLIPVSGQVPAMGYTTLYYVGPMGARSTFTAAQAVELAAPVYIGWPCTITRLGAEVTVIGDVGSTIRLGVRADSGQGTPGALLLDAGTIAGDAVAKAEITGLSLKLLPGLYWFTGTTQGVTVTPPTVTTTTGDCWPVLAPSLAGALGATPATGYQTAATVTGALPATYTVSNRTGSPVRVVGRIN